MRKNSDLTEEKVYGMGYDMKFCSGLLTYKCINTKNKILKYYFEADVQVPLK